jgi:hypothetical protein
LMMPSWSFFYSNPLRLRTKVQAIEPMAVPRVRGLRQGRALT